MNDDGGDDRTMVSCKDCGSVYAAREQPDGTLLPIGNRGGCTCGGTTFVEVESEPALEFDEDEQFGAGD